MGYVLSIALFVIWSKAVADVSFFFSADSISTELFSLEIKQSCIYLSLLLIVACGQEMRLH